jgi:hypothetical protein
MKVTMKPRYPRFFLLAVNFFLISGLVLYSYGLTEQKTQTVLKNLTGTKWVSVYNSSDSIEFIDNEHCVINLRNTINSKNIVSETIYSVEEKKVIIGNGMLWHELRGDTLYLLGISAYKMEPRTM